MLNYIFTLTGTELTMTIPLSLTYPSTIWGNGSTTLKAGETTNGFYLKVDDDEDDIDNDNDKILTSFFSFLSLYVVSLSWH